MGKQGPCYHCGIHSTPLWRNGPPEKPVLCNACGSRYRIRGSLENYAPKHAQGQLITKRARISSIMDSKKHNLQVVDEEDLLTNNVSYSIDSNDSISNKSSSDDSAVSFSQNCFDVDEEDENDIQGETRGSFWKSCIPSRKRSLVAYRCLTPIERFQRDLYSIFKYEDHSILSKNDEEDLLIYNANDLRISYNEIGLGSMLLDPHIIAPIESPPYKKKHTSQVDIKPSQEDGKVSSFNWSHNRSPPLDELEKAEPAADSSMAVLEIKEDLSTKSNHIQNHPMN